MRYLLTATLALIFFSGFATTPYDSIGVEEVKGKKYILHKVETKETLYSVSRRYNVSIYKIIENNPPTEFGLEVGQVIKIPLIEKKKEKKQKPPVVMEKEADSDTKSNAITHVVASKETLFSISRQYGVSVDEIKGWNNLSGNSLDIGQKLIIKKETKKDNKPEKRDAKRNAKDKMHVVKQSETLYSISRSYEVSVENLKAWNDLVSNEISIGQELVVGKSGKQEAIDQQNERSENETPAFTEEEVNKATRMDSALTARNNNKQKAAERKPDLKESADFGEVVEAGVATLIEGSENTRKYLALHRTAKVGTIMRVRNEMNDQEVFVRVLGKLPDTGINENVVIRISQSAYDRLGAIDPKFRVSISYIP